MTKKTVLIAEDQAIISLDLKNFLNDNNFKSVAVNNGEDLLKKYKLLKPDLIIADYNIGGKISGVDALSSINRSDGTPVIIISGAAKSKIESFAATLSNCSFIFKPFERSDLLSLVFKMLNVQSDNTE